MELIGIKMGNRKLFVKQMDQQLSSIKSLQNLCLPPKEGWVRTIRQVLGMTTQQLAGRMGVHRTRVVRIENDEIQHNVTLKTLIHTAQALECDFYYVLVPKTSVIKTLRERAEKTARIILEKINYSMKFEKQGVSDKVLKQQYEELVEKLLNGNPKYLWSIDENNDVENTRIKKR